MAEFFFFQNRKKDHSRHCNARLRIVYSYWDLRHQCREIGTRLIATADLSSLSVTQFTRGPLFGWWSTLKCDDPISMIVDSSTRLTKSSKGGMWYTDSLMNHYSLSIAHWKIKHSYCTVCIPLCSLQKFWFFIQNVYITIIQRNL